MNKEDQRYWLKKAYERALDSKDPSTQNGAIIINGLGFCLSDGVNRFPTGVEDKPERWERPLKYKIIEHAERDSIYACAKAGVCTNGHTMVCCWAACADCARGIIQSGIETLVTHKQAADRSPPFWAEEIAIALQMLEEAGVKVEYYDGPIGLEKPVLHSGKLWNP
jgi:dCMP deaminase